MAWTFESRTLQAFAALAIGLASVGVAAFDNSRYDNVRSMNLFGNIGYSRLTLLGIVLIGCSVRSFLDLLASSFILLLPQVLGPELVRCRPR